MMITGFMRSEQFISKQLLVSSLENPDYLIDNVKASLQRDLGIEIARAAVSGVPVVVRMGEATVYSPDDLTLTIRVTQEALITLIDPRHAEIGDLCEVEHGDVRSSMSVQVAQFDHDRIPVSRLSDTQAATHGKRIETSVKGFHREQIRLGREMLYLWRRVN